MSNRFKIFVISALCSLTGLFANEVSAQPISEEVCLTLSKPVCCTGALGEVTQFVGNGLDALTPVALDKIDFTTEAVPYAIVINYYDNGELVKFTELKDSQTASNTKNYNDYIGYTPEKFLQYQLANGSNATHSGSTWYTRLGRTYKLYNLIINHLYYPAELSGKTVQIRVDLGGVGNSATKQVTFEFDLLGAPILDNSNGSLKYVYDVYLPGESEPDHKEYGSPDDVDDGSYVQNVCADEDGNITIDFELSNSSYPFGNVPTELGYTYKATYLWSFSDENEEEPSKTLNFASGTKIHAVFHPDESNIYTFSPFVQYEIFKDGSSQGTSCLSPMNSIQVQYDSPISIGYELTNSDDDKALTEVAKTGKVRNYNYCANDEGLINVKFNTTLTKDGYMFDAGDLVLYKFDEGAGDYVEIDRVEEDDLGSENFFFINNLAVVDGKNTTYRFKATVYDKTQNAAISDCFYDEEFTITVKERAATIDFIGDSEVCEGGNLELIANVTGDNKATYKCTWSALDCTPNFDKDPKNLSATYTNITDKNVSLNGGVRNYRLTVSNDGCEVYDDFEVAVNPQPNLTPLSKDVEVCQGEFITLSITCDQSNATIAWHADSEFGANDGTLSSKNTKNKIEGKFDRTYFVTATSAKACPQKEVAKVNVKVNPQPDITYLGDYKVCEGGSVELSAIAVAGTAPFKFTWEWEEGGVAYKKTTNSSTSTGKFTFTPSADVAVNTTYPIKVSAVDAKSCKQGAAATGSVTVNATPTFDFDVDEACDGGSASLKFTADTGFDLDYTVTPVDAPAGTFVVDNGGGEYTVNFTKANNTTAKVYKFNVTAKDKITECETISPKSVSITVNPLPKVTLVSDATKYCVGDDVTLTATATNVTYSWEKDGSAISGTSNTLKFKATEAEVGTHIYKVIVEDNTTHCTNFETVKVVVNPLPVPVIVPGDQTKCEGESVTFSSNTDYVSYLWSTGSTDKSITIPNIKPADAKEYTLIVTDANGCKNESAPAKVKLTVNSKPVFSIKVLNSVCVGTLQPVEFTFTVTNGVTVDHFTCETNSADFTTTTYKYTPTTPWSGTSAKIAFTATSCAKSDVKNATVKINPLPTVTLKPEKSLYCDGDDIKLTATASAGVSYQWYKNNVLIDGETSASYTDYAVAPGTYSYTVKVTNGTTGCEKEDTKSVTVNARPVVDITPKDPLICEGRSVELSANGDFSSYKWSNGKTTKSITVSTAGSYSLVVTNAAGCPNIVEATSVVSIEKKPLFKATAQNTVCVGTKQPVTIKLDVTNGATVKNYTCVETGASITGNIYEYTPTVAWSGSSANLTFIAVTDHCDFDLEAEKVKATIKVNALPAVTLKSDHPDYCVGDEVTLTATATGVSYEWYKNGVKIDDESSATLSQTMSASDAGKVKYTVKVHHNTTECDNEASVEINVHALPVVSIKSDKTEICEGDFMTLTASADFKSYLWSTGETTKSIKVTTPGEYTLTVTNNNGCENEIPASYTVIVNPKPEFEAIGADVCYGLTVAADITVKVLDGNVTKFVCVETSEQKAVVDGEAKFTFTQTWTDDVTYHFTAITDKCTFTDQKDATIKVNTKPSTPDIATPDDVCDGSSVTMTIDPVQNSYEYVWYSDASCTTVVKSGKGSAGASYTIDALASGSETYYVKAFLGECESDVASVTATALPYPEKPVIADLATTTYCSNDSEAGISLSVKNPVAGLTYSWFDSSDNKIGTETTILVTPSASESYYVIATNSADCSSVKSDILSLTINKSPKIETTLYDEEPCQYDVLELSLNVVEGSDLEYIWSVDTDDNKDKTTISYKVNDSGVKSVTVYAKDKATSCVSESIEFEWNAKAAPTYTIKPDEASRHVCEGDDITLEAEVSPAYSLVMWGVKDISAAPEDPVSMLWAENPQKLTPEAGKQYYINVYDFMSYCEVEDPFVLDVFSNPDVSVEGETVVCLENVIDITIKPNDGATYSYVWTKDGNTVSTSDNFHKDSAKASDAGEYEVVITNASGCTATKKIVVTVNEFATTEIIGNDFVCKNEVVGLEAKDKDLKSYKWVAKVDDVEIATSTDYNISIDAAGYASGKEIVVTLDFEDNYCVGKTLTHTITVRELPIISNVTGVEYCLNKGGNMSLKAVLDNPNVGSTYTYYWTHNGTTVDTDNNEYTPAVSLENEGAWIVYAVENEKGCVGSEYPFEVKVDEISLDINSSKSKFCNNLDESLIVDANVTTDEDASLFTYDYVITDESDVEVDKKMAAGASVEFTKVNLLGVGNYTVTVTAHSPFGCEDSKSVSFEIVKAPDTDLNVTSHTESSTDLFEPCAKEALEFEIGDALSYTVYVDGVAVTDLAAAGFVNVGNKFTYSIDYPEVHKVYVELNDDLCSSKTREITVKPHASLVAVYDTPEGPVEVSDVDNLITLCEGDDVTVKFSADDVTSDINLTLDGSASGANQVVVSSQTLGGEEFMDQTLVAVAPNGCSRTIVIRTLKAPKTVTSFTRNDDSSIYKSIDGFDGNVLCSGEDVVITTTGAGRYELTVKRDGADLTGDDNFFPASSNDPTFVFSHAIDFIDNGTDYNEYVLTFRGFVGSCEDLITEIFRVYKPVSVELTPSASVVISDTEVTFTATPGYKSYEFFINGISQGVQEGTDNNIFKAKINDTNTIDDIANVSVVATSYAGCDDSDEKKVQILDGIAPKEVIISNDFYCSADDGVTISILDPQPGITYVLNECTSCEPIVAQDGIGVEWTGIKVDAGNTSKTFTVTAYHELLPLESVDMLNSVTVTEVKSPVKFTIVPDETVYRCDNSVDLKLDGSETGIFYQLYKNGAPEGAEIAGDGNALDLNYHVEGEIAEFKVVAYSKYDDGHGNITNTCAIDMLGQYKVDVNRAEDFLIEADPSNGNYCEGGDAINISLSGSEVGKVYELRRDGVMVAELTGDGNALDFGGYSVDGDYTIWAMWDGCSQQMIKDEVDHVTLKMWTRPAEQIVSVSDFGHYCSDADGITVTVEGAQVSDYVYTLYNSNNVIALDASGNQVVHVGDLSGAEFSWNDIPEGTYHVAISIPVVANGCETILPEFTVTKNPVPSDILLFIDDAKGEQVTDATICDGEETTITLYNTQKGTEYVLMLDGADYRNHVDVSDTHSFTFDNITEVGEYTVRASVIYDLDGINTLTCQSVFDDVVTLAKVDRPVGSATLSHEVPADKLAADPCYGEDVIVNSATPGFEYKIYRVEGSEEYIIADKTFVAVGDPAADRFFNIQTNYGEYKVYVSNGYCDDPVGSVTLVNSKFVDPQIVQGIPSMCQGDQGQNIGLAGAEIGVIYRLYGPGISGYDEYVATSTDPFVFNSLMNQDGTYYVTGAKDGGCEIKMLPEINFTVNALPVSYELKGNSFYCSPEGNVLKLTGSEIGVSYTLYRKEGAILVPVQTITGGGNELEFEPVTAGTYVAAARNKITECTSSMLGEVTLAESPAIATTDNISITSCSGSSLTLTDNLTVNATYYLVKGNDSPEKAFVSSSAYDGVNNPLITLDEAGEYTIYAAYGDDFSCLTVYASLNFVSEPIDETNGKVYFADLDDEGVVIDLSINESVGTIDDASGRIVVDNVQPDYTYTLIHRGAVVDSKTATADDTKLFFGPVYSDTEVYPGYGIGDYYVEVTKDECSATRGPITFSEQTISSIVKEVINECKDGAVVRVIDPMNGWTYRLVCADGDVTTEKILCAGGEVSWRLTEPSGTHKMEIIASKGIIELSSGYFDVEVNIVPNTSMIMLVNGVQVDGDNVEVCPSSQVWFYGNTDDAAVNAYGFELYKLKYDAVAQQQVETLVDGKFDKVNASFIYKPTNFTNGDTVVVKMNVYLASGCDTMGIAQRTFLVRNSTLQGERLYTKEDSYEYCEGETGLTLAFKDVEKGITYRLWKYTDPYRKVDNLSEIRVDSLDLVDIQELPWYYDADHAAEIIFNGWSFSNPQYKDKASAGFYYVSLETKDGCDSYSNIVEIIENPSPYGDSDINVDTCSVYFAAGAINNGIPFIDEDSKNTEFGLLDTGFLVFDNAHVGYKYELVHLNAINTDNGKLDYVIQTISDVTEGERLYFGPIYKERYDVVSFTDENGLVYKTDTMNVMGIGDYTIRVTDLSHATNCTSDIGNLTFIDEQLVTYDVFLFLNSNQTSIRTNLIPGYGHKGNHKYLDWSAAIDKVYTPDIETAPDGSTAVISDQFVEKFGDETGYSSLRGSVTTDANIVFELLDQASKTYLDKFEEGCFTANDTITIHDKYVSGCNVDTTYIWRDLDKYEEGCDSVLNITGYNYFSCLTGPNNTVTKLPLTGNFDPSDVCDSAAIYHYTYRIKEPIYKYWSPVYYKIESLRENMWGTCGFDDYDGTIDLIWESKTGAFVYRKSPNFYGEEKIPYRAYNAKMKNLRYSNISYITILCGNEGVPGDSTVFLIPNAISPNGDGYNDEFKIILPQNYEENHTSKLEVFNRWGTLVYRSSGLRYGRDCPNWDGTSKTANMLTIGEDLPQGTYFYIFTIDFNIDGEIRTKKLSGYVELRR